MSKIGNHRTGLQESEYYRWGWGMAETGMELLEWMLHRFTPEQSKAARQGWQDYHDQEKNDGE